jgi:hypothetical protein
MSKNWEAVPTPPSQVSGGVVQTALVLEHSAAQNMKPSISGVVPALLSLEVVDHLLCHADRHAVDGLGVGGLVQ